MLSASVGGAYKTVSESVKGDMWFTEAATVRSVRIGSDVTLPCNSTFLNPVRFTPSYKFIYSKY